MDSPLVQLALLPLAGVACGCLPSGVLIARAHNVDLRTTGSGNVGATNVGRVLGRKWGLLCFVLDVAKGFAPAFVAAVMFAGQQGQTPSPAVQGGWLLTGLGAIAGHIFNPLLRFRGGKGVATALGVVLGIWPYLTLTGLAAFGVWIAVVLISRYVSLASIVAALAFVPLLIVMHLRTWLMLWPLIIFAAAMVALIIIRHRGNIARLLNGTENKIGRQTRQEDEKLKARS
jgi:glycerol-3-phosphate acyltransferase PlsY